MLYRLEPRPSSDLGSDAYEASASPFMLAGHRSHRWAMIPLPPAYRAGALPHELLRHMVPAERYDLPTLWFEATRSIQLSYAGTGLVAGARTQALSFAGTSLIHLDYGGVGGPFGVPPHCP